MTCDWCRSEDDIVEQTLLVSNECGHRFCGACVSRAFSRAKHFSCPVCQATIKRSGLSEKSPEELAFARDVHWTKYVNEIYNKTREDFDSLENYNDYLEEKEVIKYNLENDIDKDATKLKVKQYQNAHREEIVANKARDLDTRRMIEQEISARQQDEELRRHESQAEESRISVARNKMRNESMEVALGERDHVSVTLPNPVLLGEKSEALFGEFGQGPGVRRALEINAPIPQLVNNNSCRQQRNGSIPALKLAKLQRLAGAAPSKAQFLERCRNEGSLWV